MSIKNGIRMYGILKNASESVGFKRWMSKYIYAFGNKSLDIKGMSIICVLINNSTRNYSDPKLVVQPQLLAVNS